MRRRRVTIKMIMVTRERGKKGEGKKLFKFNQIKYHFFQSKSEHLIGKKVIHDSL